jgi:hypothetical protein
LGSFIKQFSCDNLRIIWNLVVLIRFSIIFSAIVTDTIYKFPFFSSDSHSCLLFYRADMHEYEAELLSQVATSGEHKLPKQTKRHAAII